MSLNTNQLRAWGILCFLLLFTTISHASPIAAPDLRDGQFVYSVPSDFDPPLIGQSGVEEIQRAARQLHHPFYVVIVDSFAGSSDRDVSDALDDLASDWSQQGKFDRATSSIFLLTYKPRKYRLLAGSTWRAKLGLEGQSGVQPYLDIFANYIKGSSKDPKTGIIETMRALDTYIFDQTDPQRIAARQAAVQRAEAQRQLQAATGALDDQINRTEVLLSQPQFLPPDTTLYRNALNQAKAERATNAQARMASAAIALKNATDRLNGAVSAKRSAFEAAAAAQAQQERAAREAREAAARRETAQRLSKLLLELGLAGALLLWLLYRYRTFGTLTGKLRGEIEDWDKALLNASNNYLSFFEERRRVTELADTTGQTKASYETLTNDVGNIYPTIMAMKDRVETAKGGLQKGSFWNFRPLKEARDLLAAKFKFDTEEVNKGLFEPPTRIIEVQPQELRQQLGQQYQQTVARWDELMVALQLRSTVAQAAFPHDHLDAMLQRAAQHGIPARWLSTHPLFGNEDNDQSFYADLNAHRADDPLAYKQQLEAAQATESTLDATLARLITALEGVATQKAAASSAYGSTVLAPDDDPAITVEAARRAEEQITVALATKNSAEEVEAQAQSATELYAKCAQQIATINVAQQNGGSDLQTATNLAATTRDHASAADTRLQQAHSVHSNVSLPAGSLGNGRAFLDRANHLLTKAQRQWSENRHLDAQRSAQEATNQLNSAQREFDQCVALCAQFDAQKQQYEHQMAQMDAMRAQAEANLRRYGSRRSFDRYPTALARGGPLDYAVMMAQLATYQQSMDTEVRSARRAYEAEIARQEQAREAERQRERQRQQEAAWASSTSSSSSSWGSSSSSSSGGSSWSDSSSSSSGGGSWSDSSSSSSSSGGGDW